MKKGLKFFLSLLIIPILILNSCNYQKENHMIFGKLKNGDKIFTSSIDKIVPPGILVGKLKIVTKVPKDPNMNFGRGKGAKPTIRNTNIIKMSIDLAFEINQLDYVTIMSLKK